jgi:ketosteroid isomerase-like protein
MNGTMKSQPARMDHYFLFAFILLAFAGCNSGTNKNAAAVSTADLIAAANELDSLYLVAFNNGDADAIMKLHWNSPELRVYLPGEMQASGFDAVKASYVRDFAASKGAKLVYTNANNIPFGDAVVGHGTYRWTMPIEGGSPIVSDGRYSLVKAMKDGKMVIVLDHASVPIPPPPADATQTK